MGFVHERGNSATQRKRCLRFMGDEIDPGGQREAGMLGIQGEDKQCGDAVVAIDDCIQVRSIRKALQDVVCTFL